jgi:excinuclease UvrABC ATPase subunit
MATRTDTRSPAPHAADSHDSIRVHGARVNNLKDVSIELPKRRLTAFTGVSGSGKSSLTRLGGMCSRCEGRGTVTDFDLSALYDDSKSLDEGALTIPGYSMDGWYLPSFVDVATRPTRVEISTR